jgi:hypothetical protein
VFEAVADSSIRSTNFGEKMRKSQGFSIREKIKVILTSPDDLDQPSRETLSQLADSPDIEKIWNKVQKGGGERVNYCARHILYDVAGARVSALTVDQQPDHLEYAKLAERLAKYLEGAHGRLHLPPLPMSTALVPILQDVATALREADGTTLITRSRRNVDGSREIMHFMRMTGLAMRDWTGSWLDEVVVDLTLILFPNANVTASTIRMSRMRFAQKKKRRSNVKRPT